MRLRMARVQEGHFENDLYAKSGRGVVRRGGLNRRHVAVNP